MDNKKETKKSVEQVRLESIDRLKRNFMYTVEHEADYGRRCDRSCDEGICRCSTIENARVTEVNTEDISDKLVRKADQNSILHYCIERILVSEKLYDPDMWDVYVAPGYYGEEVRSVTVDISAPIIDKLKKLVTMTNIQKIKYILTEEYGYLLPPLDAYKNVVIHTAKLSNVIPTQNYYKAKVDASIYHSRSLPYCVVESGDGKFKIVDGHHRYAAAAYDSVPFIPVIILK